MIATTSAFIAQRNQQGRQFAEQAASATGTSSKPDIGPSPQLPRNGRTYWEQLQKLAMPLQQLVPFRTLLLALILLAQAPAFAASEAEKAKATPQHQPHTAKPNSDTDNSHAKPPAGTQMLPSVPDKGLSAENTAVDGVAGNNTTEQKTDYAKQDLAAQQDMARYALWMTIVAIISIVTSFIGLWMLWRTLRHTREAAEAARDAVTEAQATAQSASLSLEHARLVAATEMRPWLSIEVARLTEIKRTVDGADFLFDVEIENIGRTPALQIEIGAIISFPDTPMKVPERPLGYMYPCPGLLPGRRATKQFRRWVPVEQIEQGYRQPSRQRPTIGVADIFLAYKSGMDEAGAPARITCRRYRIEHNANIQIYGPEPLWNELHRLDTGITLFAQLEADDGADMPLT